MFTRKVTRLLCRGAFTLVLILTALFIFDLWYDILPSTIQTKLPLHTNHPVIVDVKIETCGLFSSCSTSATKYLGWEKIDKDLYLGTSWFNHAYLYTKSTNQDELERSQKVVVSIAHSSVSKDLPPELLEEIEVKPVEGKNAKEKAKNLGWVDAGYGLWVKYGKHVPGQEITAVKVLYTISAIINLPNWELPLGNIAIGSAEPRVAFRRGIAANPPLPQLTFNSNGRFKIMQLADLHMSTGWGECDCPVPPPGEGEMCFADLRTHDLVEDVMHEENPDFVVFSGDQIMADRAPDPETALLKALAPVIERKLPFALILGNHDDGDVITREKMMELVSEMPLFLGSAGPDNVPGVGNYVLTVGPPSSMTDVVGSALKGQQEAYPSLSLYFLDSHTKLPKPWTVSAYDWIKQEQHDFLREEHQKIRTRLEGYSKIPLAMSFIHIPLPDFRDDLIDEGGQYGLARIGRKREGVVAPSVDLGTLNIMREIDVSVLGVGHDHANDYCQLQQNPSEDHHGPNIWMCYGGATGEGGYGGYPDSNGLNYERRVRFYEIDMNEPSIDTWHRVQNHDGPVNKVKLVTGGKAVYIAKNDREDTERVTDV